MKHLRVTYAIVAALVILLSGCQLLGLTDPAIEITGAAAIAFADARTAIGDIGSGLYRITTSGEVQDALVNATATSARVLGGNLLLEVESGLFAFGAPRYYVASVLGTVAEVDTISTPAGQNERGDIVFEDASILRAASGTLEQLNTTLNAPRVSDVSGNFAILDDDSIAQVFDTVTGARYNVARCNGPDVVALSSTVALVNDCSTNSIVDMQTGDRTDPVDPEFRHWNSEAVYLGDGEGALIMTQDGTDSYGVYHVDETGASIQLLTGLDVGSGNIGTQPNALLFYGDGWVIVKELSSIRAKNWPGNDDERVLFGSLNVTSVDVADGNVYYVAEDNFGNAVLGSYLFSVAAETQLDSSVRFDSVQAFK